MYVLYYVLSSNIGQSQIDRLQNGANREGLNFEQLNNFYIPCPSVEIQRSLNSFLFSKLSEILETCKRVEVEISLLQEYRTALINEVVTGKVCVS
jgi:restriction endonuclease S subunit